MLLYVSGKLTTYPSPKPTFCLKWELSINVDLSKGRWAVSQKQKLIRCFLVLLMGAITNWNNAKTLKRLGTMPTPQESSFQKIVSTTPRNTWLFLLLSMPCLKRQISNSFKVCYHGRLMCYIVFSQLPRKN